MHLDSSSEFGASSSSRSSSSRSSRSRSSLSIPSGFDDLVVYLSDFSDDPPSIEKISFDRRSSHGRYSKFGEAEAALLADEASDGPVRYKASVEK